MEVNEIKAALINQRKFNLPGNLYYNTQIEFAYNTNHIEGSTITSDETASIYDTGTIIAEKDKIVVLKDLTEIKNHFTLFKYMLDTLDDKLSEDLIKKYHGILKSGTLSEDEKEWFNVGEYKKLKNYVGTIKTTLPQNVSSDMKKLLTWYESITVKTLEDIIEFHVRFEKIHPFQDGNGRVGRIIIFRECLVNNIMPFYIEDRNKAYYILGMKEYQNNDERTRLIETCKNSQENYEKTCKYFLK